MRTLKRDPFARQELRVWVVKANGRTCDWCGCGADQHGNLRVFSVVPDAGRERRIAGHYCSVGCMRAYNS